jgi:tripartite-type tricarboxylate transporter receptor subunit TctC
MNKPTKKFVVSLPASPDMKERELKMGFRVAGGSPARLAAFLKSEIAKWADLARSANLVTK